MGILYGKTWKSLNGTTSINLSMSLICMCTIINKIYVDPIRHCAALHRCYDKDTTMCYFFLRVKHEDWTLP